MPYGSTRLGPVLGNALSQEPSLLRRGQGEIAVDGGESWLSNAANGGGAREV